MVAPHDSAKLRSITEALSGPNAKEWMDDIKDKIESMRINQVWDLVDLPAGCKGIRKQMGSQDQAKSRLIY